MSRLTINKGIRNTRRANPIFNCLVTKGEIHGTKWEIHNHDEDINNPSCPHMHAVDEPWKLDIYTGNIYHSQTGTLISKMRKKELAKIWMSPKVMKIILAERARYSKLREADPQRYPELPPLLLPAQRSGIIQYRTTRIGNRRRIVSRKSSFIWMSRFKYNHGSKRLYSRYRMPRFNNRY